MSARDVSPSMRTGGFSPRPLPPLLPDGSRVVSGEKLTFRRNEGPAVLRRVSQ